MTDSHAHLNHPDFASDLEEVLARARSAGVGRMIVVGYDLASSRRAVELAERETGVFAAVGVHPHDAETWSSEARPELRELARRGRVVAIGETGLDYHRDLSSREAQRASLQAHLEVAIEAGLPVILHNRKAAEDLLAILEGPIRRLPAMIWHCFSGERELARRALELGLFLGLGGPLTFQNARRLREVAAELPLERVLLETDCPYLAPHPLRGRRNEPANLALIAEELARLRRISLETLLAQTEKNAEAAFPGLKEAS
jgi:TatD DNase family protein